MKCRVFKKQDGRVIYSWPSHKYQQIANFEGCKFPPETEGLEFVDLEESDLPSEQGRDWFSHGPLYFNGVVSKENLKFDEGWSEYLMSIDVLKKKYINRLRDEIDAELNSQNPDVIKVAKAQREVEKSKNYPDPTWYQIALDGLDDRVAKGEPDKPIIRQKLQEKLNAIGTNEPIGTPDNASKKDK